MPTSDSGKAIASRNATTHGLFARDVVLPSLGEDPEGYHQMQDEWTQQLSPRNLLERHYVEKIAAASWRLRRLHRWQAQLFEDDTLTENERIDRLDKVIRHETALQRQIDTAVKMLHKDAPQLYTRRLRDQVLEDMHICERECRDEPETDTMISLETSNRLYQLRKANTQATNELSEAPLDTAVPEAPQNCENELPSLPPAPLQTPAPPKLGGGGLTELGMEGPGRNCQNELRVPKPGAASLTGPTPSYEAQRKLRETLAPVPHKHTQSRF
jgi:hypothetical protein